ncbi:MAG TPA: flagellar biosynthesis protein FlhA [Polyangiaceae bacterium]|nr:flagellar biosynthesis protein FlhA [Polyangiaceae bacterium]
MAYGSRLLRFRRAGARTVTADAGLAALVVAMVGLMVVPLPTWLLDLLLATNLAASVSILLVTIYVTGALEVAAFPTLLLITTLIRLALNVSSTRLILLKGDAGEVIQAFGQFVVSGNYVVGSVVFLILALIQFIVVAKGSERVAEVGARFALDAMPGKQMAIDAELRAGSIDHLEAQQRRRTLSRESQFYGAMDGAMKFVKGDVIASFVIAIINIGAGLAIGVAQRGMPFAQALERYALLTIGDGLVSQIPSLILATSAGILVTRVASEDGGKTLGEELSSQLLGVPKALRVAGIFVLGLALVPGLPTLPFLCIGALLVVVSWPAAVPLDSDGVPLLPAGSPRLSRLPAPWSLSSSPALEERLAAISDDQTSAAEVGVNVACEGARERLFQELGVIVPSCRLVSRSSLPRHSALLSIREVPAKTLSVPEDLEGVAATQFLGDALADVLIARAHDFMGLQSAQLLLDELARVAPASVQQVVPKLVSLATLSEILRRLVEEGVSVRDLASIVEALAQLAHLEKDPLVLTEHVRSWLRRAITYEVTRGSGLLEPLTLDESIEEVIRGAISQTSAGSFLTLSPAAGRDIVSSLERALAGCPEELRRRPVILTQPDVRRFVRKLIESDLPRARVVTFSELLPETTIRAAGTATLRRPREE